MGESRSVVFQEEFVWITTRVRSKLPGNIISEYRLPETRILNSGTEKSGSRNFGSDTLDSGTLNSGIIDSGTVQIISLTLSGVGDMLACRATNKWCCDHGLGLGYSGLGYYRPGCLALLSWA